MHDADRIERVPLEPSPKLETRRIGLAFVCLVVATNFVPWMELAEAGIDSTRPPSAAESFLGLVSCLAAVALMIGGWLLGRRLPNGTGRLSARDAGLALALLASGANLALAAIVHRLAPGSSFADSIVWFGPVWYGLILPAGLMAAFYKGRASIPGPRLVRPAPVRDQAAVSS